MKENENIYQFIAKGDNYGVLVHDPENNLTVSIDAPDADAVEEATKEKGWPLTHVFITHHHYDHTNGNEALRRRTGCTIVGPRVEADRIPAIDYGVVDGGTYTFGSHDVEIIETPGHTFGHVLYYFKDLNTLFTGDTLFAMGCGRVFEGTMKEMWQSLERIKQFPEETIIYCGHEYTRANAEFALSVDPDNKDLIQRAEKVQKQYEAGDMSLPTTLREELRTNPFLRVDDSAIKKATGMEREEPWEIFGELRTMKDNY